MKVVTVQHGTKNQNCYILQQKRLNCFVRRVWTSEENEVAQSLRKAVHPCRCGRIEDFYSENIHIII